MKKVRSSDGLIQSSVDVFDGIKRAMRRRGLIPEKNELQKTKPSSNRFQPKKSSDNNSDQKSEEQDNAVPAASPDSEGPEKLVDVTELAHDILFKADTVFPFNLFPDTVTLDREKITIARRYFVQVAKITSVPVRDILSVEANVGPFFGSIRIASRYFITNPYSITFLWRKDAQRLQRLLQGYIIAHEREIDCSSVPKKELIKLLNDLGQGDTG